MAIVKSEIIDNSLQSHNIRYCRDRHTDHLGKQHIGRFNCPKDTDPNTLLKDRAATIWLGLQQREIEEVVKRIAAGERVGKLGYTDWVAVKTRYTEVAIEIAETISELENEKTNLDSELKTR
jgi:hypothetical protein